MDFLYGLPVTYVLGLALWIGAGLLAVRWLLLARRRFKDQPGRLRLVHAGLSLWMLLAVLTLGEVYFAFVYDTTDSFNTTNTSAVWYRRHVRLNNEDFRDARNLERERPAGTTGIWFIGDSFTLGHGVPRVEDRFSDRVAAALEREAPGKFVVNTLADLGAHTETMRVWLQTFWEHGYEPPEVVVYVLCLNDIQPFLPESVESDRPPRRFWDPVVDRSFLLDFVRSRLWERRAGARDWYGDMAQGYTGEPGQRLLQEIDRLHGLCRSHNVELRVVIFPFLHNLGPDYPFAAAHRRIATHCRDTEIPVLDLRPVLEPHRAEGLMVNRFDSHPNERAHALAAQEVVGMLRMPSEVR
jgi:hypothetical protein